MKKTFEKKEEIFKKELDETKKVIKKKDEEIDQKELNILLLAN
jgi:hypothetical protein